MADHARRSMDDRALCAAAKRVRDFENVATKLGLKKDTQRLQARRKSGEVEAISVHQRAAAHPKAPGAARWNCAATLES